MRYFGKSITSLPIRPKLRSCFLDLPARGLQRIMDLLIPNIFIYKMGEIITPFRSHWCRDLCKVLLLINWYFPYVESTLHHRLTCAFQKPHLLPSGPKHQPLVPSFSSVGGARGGSHPPVLQPWLCRLGCALLHKNGCFRVYPFLFCFETSDIQVTQVAYLFIYLFIMCKLFSLSLLAFKCYNRKFCIHHLKYTFIIYFVYLKLEST